MKGILECCVDSVESAIAAKNGGADRLELCQGLVIGGVTPGTALFQEIKNQMDIRIHALMRPRLEISVTPDMKLIFYAEISVLSESLVQMRS